MYLLPSLHKNNPVQQSEGKLMLCLAIKDIFTINNANLRVRTVILYILKLLLLFYKCVKTVMFICLCVNKMKEMKM